METKSRRQKDQAKKLEFSIEKIQLDKIIGAEPFTSNFLAQLDYETDLSIDLTDWKPSVAAIACLQSVFFLVKRKENYLYLGSGRMLALQRQLHDPHDEVHAFVFNSSRVATEIKLDILAAELLLVPAIFRTRRLAPQKMMGLWENLMIAGAAPIRGGSARSFARATGFSHNSLKGQEAHEAESLEMAKPVSLPEDIETQ